MKHPKNKFERRLIETKKQVKKFSRPKSKETEDADEGYQFPDVVGEHPGGDR